MKNKYCFIDFEYNETTEEILNLVSCSSDKTGTDWLFHSSTFKENLKNNLIELGRDHTFVAFNVVAEASAFYSLGLDPRDFKWIDLHLEYKCLLNHNHNLQYGKQLIKGRVKTTKPPKNKWEMTEEEKKKADNSKPETNLAAACFKLLNEKIDTDFKDEIRDIIIANDPEEILKHKDDILRYNESDIKYLKPMLKKILKWYKFLLRDKFNFKELLEEMLVRGNFAARTAVMERVGYPFDYESTKAFSQKVPDIIWEVQNEINQLFPDILPFNKQKDRTFTWSHVRTKKWIREQGFKGWVKADGGDVSLSLDAFKKFFNFRHNYPKDNFGAQMVRYLTLKQNLNGFSPTSKNSFWDYVGSDKRVRPYFNIYGAQSARSQPKATGFLFLKSAWMRSLCQPAKGKAIGAIDYGSQEFLLAALMSKDEEMIKAYHSGDVYLYFAKVAEAVPWDGERKDYEEVRDIFKAVTLGMSYNMSKYGLAIELTNKLGRKVNEDEAQKYIHKFEKAYKKYHRKKAKIISEYRREKHIKLPCGWYMWGDNNNQRSVGNVPIQGFGSSILRKAVCLAQDRGLTVIKTLHDAIYIESDHMVVDSSLVTLASCMADAFKFYFPDEIKEKAKVRLDGKAWGPDLEEGYKELELLGKVKFEKYYVDERATNEYNKFKKYFELRNIDDEEI